MKKLPKLAVNDYVEIIAPASRCSDEHLLGLKKLLESWQLRCLIKEDIFGEDLLCAQTDEVRFHHLKNAIENPETKAIICARGGYGSMRLIPQLAKIQPPKTVKLFLGMSDITCLHLFFQQQWLWPTIHGSASTDKSLASIASLKSLLFHEKLPVEFNQLIPLNELARRNRTLKSKVTGGNLTLIQSGIGTCWEMISQGKIILLEETGERGYRIDRMLQHLMQANLFNGAEAILLGDFIAGDEPNGTSLIEPILQRFAEHINIPVLKISSIGHGFINFPIPLGVDTELKLGEQAQLVCFS